MFARRSPFIDLVEQATSENLTEPNWDLNVRVCDELGRVDNGAKDCAAVLLRKITQRNPTVTKHAIVLAEACVKNCGLIFHQEVASKPFMNALIKHVNDKTVHESARNAILTFIQDFANEFRNRPGLANVDVEYQNLLRQGVVFPSKKPVGPDKDAVAKEAAEAEQREREELELALALSMSESESKKRPVRTAPAPAVESPKASASRVRVAEPVVAAAAEPVGTVAGPVQRAQALYDFAGAERGELPFRKGDIVEVVEQAHQDWWRGRLNGSAVGLFPASYVQLLAGSPTQPPASASPDTPAASGAKRPTSLPALEAAIKPELIDRLLGQVASTEASRTSVVDNPALQETLAACLVMKSDLAELLVELGRRRDESAMLNTRFTQSRATFERLLAAATARPTRIAAGSDGAAWAGQYAAGRAPIGQAPYAPMPQQQLSYEPSGGQPQAQYLAAPQQHQQPPQPQQQQQQQQQVYYDQAGQQFAPQQPIYAAAATAAPAPYGVAQQPTGYPAQQPVYQEQQQPPPQQYQPAQPMYQEQQPVSAPPPQQQTQPQYAAQPGQGQYGNTAYAQGPPPQQGWNNSATGDTAGYASSAQPVQYSPQPVASYSAQPVASYSAQPAASFNPQQQQQQQQQGQQQYAPGPGPATGYPPSASRMFAGSLNAHA